MSVDRFGAPGYPAAAPWALWIDRNVRCDATGRHGRCQLVRGHAQPHAVVLQVAAGRRAWRWTDDDTSDDDTSDHDTSDHDTSDHDGWLDDGGPWGNVATDRAPWIPGWP